jgi:low affinity Fe/Cu permease
MKDDRGDLDLTKQMEEKDELIRVLRQRINELMGINKSHQQLLGKQIVENEELKTDNKRLAKQIDDYFNGRINGVRKSGL